MIKNMTESKSNRKSSNPVDEEAEKRRKLKSARLIVRNLPFSSTEKKLKELFSQYGNVLEINILKKPDGKLVGCCFVQYEKKISAAAAIAKISGKPFLGRPIVVDWAVAKKKFMSSQSDSKDGVEIKEEPDDDGIKKEEAEIKEEPASSEESSSEESDDEDEKPDMSGIPVKKESEDSDDDEEDDEEDEDDDSEEEVKPGINGLKNKRISNDVSEGKTIFIKNVPFAATEEDLKKAVKKFGRFYYVKICVDPMTEHSKGTAFVKFLEKESAEKCLAAGTEFEIDGTVLDPHPAVPRQNLAKESQKSKHPSDSRNLFLLKEGVVAAGSKGSEGVSESDMAKRLQLEKWKRQIVKDLGKFVSKTRLVIHNLPIAVDDNRLRKIVLKHAPKGSRLTETKVMRDLKNFDGKGQPLSKGFGFVTFTSHEDALSTLRLLNNNPSVFKTHRRPIVSFSVESKKALNVKQKRLEKSKLLNAPKPTEPVIKIENDGKRKRKRKSDKKTGSAKLQKTEEVNKIPFIGMTATPGVKKFMNLDIKKQAMLHKTSLKKAKAKQKQKKMAQLRRKNIQQKNERKQKVKVAEDKDFSNLVAKYKSQINTGNTKKWFE